MLHEQRITSETNENIFNMLAGLADMRKQVSEESLMKVGDYDPNSVYHDLNIDTHKATHSMRPDALKHMAEMVLHDFDTTGYQLGETEFFDYITQEIALDFEQPKARLESGNRLMVVTAHKTRLEPAVVGLLVQSALAESPEEHESLRDKTTIMISRYLSCFDINVGKLAAGKDRYINIVNLATELGSIALSFPNTPNMRELSGVDTDFQRQYNARLLQSIKSTPGGDICVVAANGTMEKQVDGVYPISKVKSGTAKLISDGWDVLPIASAHDVDKPFSVVGKFTPAEEVTDKTIHDGMQWIADTLTERGVAATYPN